MSTEQEQWAAQIREIPTVFRRALLLSDDHAIRYRPAASEWSAVEVVGHMIDKMQIWTSRSDVCSIFRWFSPVLLYVSARVMGRCLSALPKGRSCV